MPVRLRNVQSGAQAEFLAGTLIYASRWFKCTPLGDDLSEFTIKDEGSAWEALVHCGDLREQKGIR